MTPASSTPTRPARLREYTVRNGIYWGYVEAPNRAEAVKIGKANWPELRDESRYQTYAEVSR